MMDINIIKLIKKIPKAHFKVTGIMILLYILITLICLYPDTAARIFEILMILILTAVTYILLYLLVKK